MDCLCCTFFSTDENKYKNKCKDYPKTQTMNSNDTTNTAKNVNGKEDIIVSEYDFSPSY